MALVIALAITTGVHNKLQTNLLGIYAHVVVLEKNGNGVENWRELRQKLLQIPHVTGAAPALFGAMFAKGPRQARGISLPGIDVSSEWAVRDTLRPSAQKLWQVGDEVNGIELRLDNLDLAPQVAKAAEAAAGPNFAATTWKEQNRPLFRALEIEKLVTVVTIGLIELVAALNILIALVMMVMEKYRDIAVLMSIGARRKQIRNIFILQGVLIGVIGTAAGLVGGETSCYLPGRYPR